MNLSGKQALMDACPELYENLQTEAEIKNILTPSDGRIVKEPHNFGFGWKNEIRMNKLLQGISADAPFMPTIYSVTDERLVMEDVGGRTLGVSYDPEGDELDERDEDLAAGLSDLTDCITSIFGENEVLVHGDYSPNNIRETDRGLVVLDFEKSRVAGPSERYRNAAQLITRLWFNKPLMNRVFDLQVDRSTDERLFAGTVLSEIARKISFGVQHYPENSVVQPAELGRLMVVNLIGIESKVS